MKQLIENIRKIDNSVDLNLVIRAVKAQQKYIRAMEASTKRDMFSAGDSVNVSSKTGLRPGVITKVNRVRCDVTINGQSYSVPMSIMEAA
jgi:2C-methyl-D-erythritol 2,4-cyclodiphosphate synthase